MKHYKYHYVYRITNIVTGMYYYGDRSCNCQPKEDIGIKYFSTSTLRLFIVDQKANPQDYKYKIVKIFETCRDDAKQLEVDLHKKFDVKNHEKFINRANQPSSKFSGANIKITNSFRAKMSAIMTGRKASPETKEKLRLSHLGYKVKDSTKEKLRLINTGKKMSAEAIEKTRQGSLGLKRSEETRKRMSIAKKKCFDKTKHNTTLHIKIFNTDDVEMFDCVGNFRKTLKEFNLPLKLQDSYKNNSEPIFSNMKKQHLQRLINRGADKYIGWYAKLIS